MCGLVGVFDPAEAGDGARLARLIEGMVARIAHRGPDGSGHWVEGETGLALGSCRLAIIDITAAGHQPMTSASGRHVLAFNGEIYNAAEIAAQLNREGRAAAWRGHSDTEVLVEAIEAWGLDAALERFNGMFAFAVYDRENRTLSLVRDRLGIKPLYYAQAGGKVFFGSELKALEAHPDFDRTIDRRWLDAYLHGRSSGTARTVYECCRQLPPGSVLQLRTEELADLPEPRRYWSAAAHAQNAAAGFAGTSDEVESELERLLLDAVKQRLVADVPVGLLLSGGIDSSTVLAIAQAASSSTIRTFSVGFDDAELDESGDARRIAAHLGSEHHEIVARSEDLQKLVPQLPEIMDEPFSDPTIISTYFAYRLASQSATVVLSGDGGDEVFAGYPRHRSIVSAWRWAGWAPTWSRQFAARALTLPSERAWDRVAMATRPLLPARARQRTVGAKVHRIAEWLPAASPSEMYERANSRWDASTELVKLVGTYGTHRSGPTSEASAADIGQQILLAELEESLPRTQLAKVDRASMAVSVEARVPLLDHRVVEFALGLPSNLTYGQPEPKALLKRVLGRHLPNSMFDRPKSGFLLPLGEWLRGPLRDWATELLDPARIEREGYLRAEPFAERWRQHLEGHADQTRGLWPALMFQLWLESRHPPA